jgi:hypothetical protein
MSFVLKFATVLLIGSLLIATLPAQAMPSSVGRVSGGCHSGQKMPPPKPATYNCCQAGHNSALLLSPHLCELAVVDMLSRSVLSPIARTTNLISGGEFLTNNQPPGALPLRI